MFSLFVINYQLIIFVSNFAIYMNKYIVVLDEQKIIPVFQSKNYE